MCELSDDAAVSLPLECWRRGEISCTGSYGPPHCNGCTVASWRRIFDDESDKTGMPKTIVSIPASVLVTLFRNVILGCVVIDAQCKVVTG